MIRPGCVANAWHRRRLSGVAFIRASDFALRPAAHSRRFSSGVTAKLDTRAPKAPHRQGLQILALPAGAGQIFRSSTNPKGIGRRGDRILVLPNEGEERTSLGLTTTSEMNQGREHPAEAGLTAPVLPHVTPAPGAMPGAPPQKNGSTSFRFFISIWSAHPSSPELHNPAFPWQPPECVR